ncbi:MAG: hypothetical protein QNL04_06705 [SAR324 cluster bacterium]|nr:hypothetical protein [SAR324 cluster bacterium]
MKVKSKGYGKVAMPPHNLVFTLLGAALLWFGWFGFNAGSALSSGALAANALVVTHISAASGLFSWVMMEWFLLKKPSALGAASGLVAGLVAITPGAGFVSAPSSMFIGLMGGVVCFYGVRLKGKFGFDDSLDAFGVHGLGGIFGALATGIFATTVVNSAGRNGLINDFTSGVDLLFEQVFAVGFTIVYAGIGTLIIVKVLDAIMGLRVSEEIELTGLDSSLHGEQAYQN